MTVKAKIKKVNKILEKFYGIPSRSEIPSDPVDMLIATILSQNTNDKNSYKAFLNLKNNFTTWEEIAALKENRIEKHIKIAGLGKQKASAIKLFLSTILKEKGEISLKYLEKLNDEEILKELTRFNGIGIKTASCVLQFSLRRNICPVDTHVHRTMNRIGLVNTSAPDKSFIILKNNMPDFIAHSFHTNLIRLGREICKPAAPICSICPVQNICEFKFKNFLSNKVYKENSFMLLDSIK
jgi:endonuclease III